MINKAVNYLWWDYHYRMTDYSSLYVEFLTKPLNHRMRYRKIGYLFNHIDREIHTKFFYSMDMHHFYFFYCPFRQLKTYG